MKDRKAGLPLTENGALKVELIPMPSGDNPWRKKEDYIKEQKRDSIRFYITIASLIVSVLSVLATSVVAILTIKSLMEK